MNETHASVFRLSENHKFTIVALRGTNIAPDAVVQDILLDCGLWLLGHPPVTVDETWQKWLGTLQTGALEQSNLVIIATEPSACPFVLDGRNQALERHCLDMLIALGFSGLCFDSPGMILSGFHLDAQATESTQVRQVRDTAVYQRVRHAIPSLTRDDLVSAGTLTVPISTLRKQKHNRLFKGLHAAHKGFEGRYDDERLHQFVRSLEAVMRPETGRTERQFVHRAQVFIGRSQQRKIIARQLYRLRSCVEHMNEYTTELLNVTTTTQAAETLAQRRSIQAGLLATHVYRHILNTPHLLAIFMDEQRTHEFWATPDHEQDQTWATNPIDLEMLADKIMDPFSVHGINKNPRHL